MKPTGETFNIRFKGDTISIETYKSKGIEVYLVKLSDSGPLFITKSVSANTNYEFWTSVPEGQLTLANEIGKIIDERNNLPTQTTLF